MASWATKKDFFECPVPRQEVTLSDGTGRKVWVYGLTCGEKDDYENRVMAFDAASRELKMQNARAILIQLTVRDPHGNRLFAESDIGKLTTVPAQIAEPILKAARRLSAMATGEIEGLVKNSEMGQALSSGDCGSGSPPSSDGPKPKCAAASAPSS